MTADRSSAADVVLRAEALAAARGWLGTPYCHQASCRGAGSDCLGLVRGVWRALYGAEPEPVPPYGADWAEGAGPDLLAAAGRWLLPLAPGRVGVGDVLVFRMRDRGGARHVGIVSAWGDSAGARFIHAYSGHDVCETRLTEPWLRRVAGFFRFPAGGL
jgi:NlpC/P60 family putative phage cell wall peptidase